MGAADRGEAVVNAEHESGTYTLTVVKLVTADSGVRPTVERPAQDECPPD
jgi:hypothetical protein